MTEFQLASTFAPAGSQPVAIKKLIDGLENNEQYQTLLGVTGSGQDVHDGKRDRRREQANAGACP